MPRKKVDREYTDAKGDTHKVFTDGRTEIYHRGYDPKKNYMEITDEADEMVNRRRFMPYTQTNVGETLATREEDAKAASVVEKDGPIPGLDGLEEEDHSEDEEQSEDES